VRQAQEERRFEGDGIGAVGVAGDAGDRIDVLDDSRNKANFDPKNLDIRRRRLIRGRGGRLSRTTAGRNRPIGGAGPDLIRE
jgi:hypothetical protein